ncbi:Alpha/Beta hydrolase protein, partial [Piptocephalis cylindrospora]
QIYTPLKATASEDRPAIVLLHGYFGTHTNWQVFSQALADRVETNVYVPDLRNHGQSAWGLPMTYDDFSADLGRYLEENHLDRAFVVGHSVGGSIAMHGCLHLDMSIAQVISGIFLVDIGPKAMLNIPQVDLYLECCRLVREYRPKSLEDADAFLIQFIDVTYIREHILQACKWSENDQAFLPGFDIEKAKDYYMGMIDFPMTRRTYNTYKGRAHFFMGDDSPLVSSLTEEDIQPFMANFTISVLEGGH